MPLEAQGRDGVLDTGLLQRGAKALHQRFGLDALWLFGSAARGAPGKADLDLAALFHRQPSPVELLEARETLGALMGVEVDLVDLDRASPILVMQVLRYGKLLVDRDPARRHRLVAAAPGRYEDLRILRREGERALLDRVRRGRS